MKFKKVLLALALASMMGTSVCSCSNTNNEIKDSYEIYELAKQNGGFNGTYEEWLESIKGAPGKDGTTITNVIAGKVDNEKGTASYVLIYSDGSSYEIVIPLIKGDKGDQGIKGDTGPKGDQGDKGDTGANGTDGTNGVDGEKGETGPKGDKGQDGQNGQDGVTPHIGENGNWFIGDTDTNKKAVGEDASPISVKNVIIVNKTNREITYKVEYSDGTSQNITINLVENVDLTTIYTTFYLEPGVSVTFKKDGTGFTRGIFGPGYNETFKFAYENDVIKIINKSENNTFEVIRNANNEILLLVQRFDRNCNFIYSQYLPYKYLDMGSNFVALENYGTLCAAGPKTGIVYNLDGTKAFDFVDNDFYNVKINNENIRCKYICSSSSASFIIVNELYGLYTNVDSSSDLKSIAINEEGECLATLKGNHRLVGELKKLSDNRYLFTEKNSNSNSHVQIIFNLDISNKTVSDSKVFLEAFSVNNFTFASQDNTLKVNITRDIGETNQKYNTYGNIYYLEVIYNNEVVDKYSITNSNLNGDRLEIDAKVTKTDKLCYLNYNFLNKTMSLRFEGLHSDHILNNKETQNVTFKMNAFEFYYDNHLYELKSNDSSNIYIDNVPNKFTIEEKFSPYHLVYKFEDKALGYFEFIKNYSESSIIFKNELGQSSFNDFVKNKVYEGTETDYYTNSQFEINIAFDETGTIVKSLKLEKVYKGFEGIAPDEIILDLNNTKLTNQNGNYLIYSDTENRINYYLRLDERNNLYFVRDLSYARQEIALSETLRG